MLLRASSTVAATDAPDAIGEEAGPGEDEDKGEDPVASDEVKGGKNEEGKLG